MTNEERKERNRLRVQEWRKNNPEKRREQNLRARSGERREDYNAYQREYRQNRLDPKKAAYWNRKSKLKNGYGLTLEQFEAMVTFQGGRCAVCNRVPEEGGRNGFHVDHDHATGKIRSLLCGHCNRGLGQFKDDPERLKNAILYLAFASLA